MRIEVVRDCTEAGSREAVKILEAANDAQALYQLACTLALASTVIDPTEGAAADDRGRRDSDRAVDAIRRAIALGFSSHDMAQHDPDSLGGRADFQFLMMDLVFPAQPFAAAP
jgi:hypothetical protein